MAIPPDLTTMEGKSSAQLNHYWDSFNFRDSLDGVQSGVAEQAFVDYIVLLPGVSLNEAQKSIDAFMKLAEQKKETFTFFKLLFDKYWYNPNSPQRNDLLYAFVLQFLLNSDLVDDQDKVRYKYQLNILSKNKPGSKANSFYYWLKNGEVGKLSEIQSPFTLIVFYEPGCNACETSISQMKASVILNKLIDSDMLSILAVYPEGNEEIWKAYRSNIPDSWINGLDRDREILKHGIYDLKASPTIYLLDENKFVVLKDVDFLQVEKFFDEKQMIR